MSKWIIFHHSGSESIIEADSVSLSGTVLVFLKHSELTNAQGQIQGEPVAFTDMADPNNHLAKKMDESDAEVLHIV